MEAVTITGRFPELFGFALIEPSGLRELLGEIEGTDVLRRFTESDDGERASVAGVAIPVMRVEPRSCTIRLRDSPTPDPHVTSAGWVLHVTGGEVLLLGLGYLKVWNPQDPRHSRIPLASGWYAVQILGHRLDDDGDGDEGAYEFVLTPTAADPVFSADLTQDLNLWPNG